MGRRTTTFGRIVRTGMLNFVRNAWLAVAAMAIMIITLTIILFSLIVNATFRNTVDQITDKINISIYLKDTVSEAQAKTFVDDLRALPSVEKVSYLDKAAALRAYMKQNVGNESLLKAINETDNPLPATIQVKPRDLNQLGQIRSFIEKPDNKKLQSDPASDNGDRREAIDKITHATNIMRRAGVVAVAVFATISVLIIFNTIQMAIFNRRDELQIMRLLGASTWYIRGPFVIEAIIYGILSAIISILLINALFITASNSLQATSLGILDISYSQQYFRNHFWWLLVIQLALGILIGAASSIIATRRYLKFKTPKK
ncbi:ABC transporter permease [Candidatus Saccharibacteria bacterium]|nr:ABC transporter permease [Candidatus Saccharibacteria bacterium]HPR09077.1 permease-like cell division protein FtsX [Candidatus Saccharibacteria bacterium]